MKYDTAITNATGEGDEKPPVPPVKGDRLNTGGEGVGSRPGPLEYILVPTHKIFCKGGAFHGCR